MFISLFILTSLLLSSEIYKEWLRYNIYNRNKMTFSEFIEYYYYPNLTRPFNKDKSYYEIQKIKDSKITFVTKIQVISITLFIIIALTENLLNK